MKKFNAEIAEEKIIQFMRDKLKKSGLNGYVIGLSGGIDSTVVAYMAAKAGGPEKVYGMIMPSQVSLESDADDGILVAKKLEMKYERRDIAEIFNSFLKGDEDKIQRGNLMARIRMTLLYNKASEMKRLVLGTGNRTELLLGYFTKYGDGGVDLEPIGNLYKTQVWELARVFGVPEKLIQKAPSAGLWPGQTDEKELGAEYKTLDKILVEIVDKRQSIKDTAGKLDIDKALVEKVYKMVQKSEHKRRMPPVAEI